MRNLNYISKNLREEIVRIIDSPFTHKIVKDTLMAALDKDCVDSYYEIKYAAELLKKVMDELIR